MIIILARTFMLILLLLL